jgi:hypothetical protein
VGFSFLIFIIKYNMGLLDLLLQNQSNLDINPVPQQGNGPINPATGEFNTGTTPFQQTWDSNNTYINSFEGGQNTGIQPPTLSETGLDIDNPNFVSSTSTPNTLTLYPATAVGGLGQSAVQFLQIWNPVINYNDVITVTTDSPLKQSLPETGLDNTDPSAVLTTVSPINTTNYPNLATGEYNSVPNQYSQIYGPNRTYLNTYDPNVQPNSLDETGLDIENIGLVSTTAAPNPNTNYPALSSGEFGSKSNNFNQIFTSNNTYLNTFNPQTQPNTVVQGQTGLDNTNFNSAPTTVTPYNPTSYPNQATGEFGGASTQYNPIYGPGSTYENKYINDPIVFDTLQTTTLDETGLDNTNSQFASTTLVPIDNTSYPAPPQTNLGEFNGALPALTFTPQYNPGFGYLNNYSTVISNAGNPQINTLGQTGLDIENSNAITFTPNAVSVPTSYPALALGEFGGVSTQYTQIWNPSNQYIANFNPNTQPNTLDETGLDNTDSSFAPTTATPSTITQYPQFAQGEFNGAPTQYAQIWNSNNPYIINYNPLIQPSTLGQTGLDIENTNAAPTTTTPNTTTVYPPLVSGEFNTGADQYTQNWSPTNTYLNSNFTNAQEGTLDLTGLDNTDTNELPTTFVPDSITAPTVYPQPAQTYLGEFQGAPSQFTPLYTPNPGQSYLDNYTTIISNAGNQQVNTLGQTDLDNSDSNSSPTTVQNIDPTTYPLFVQGEFNSSPNLFNQIWNPNFGYYLNSNPSAQTDTLDETGLDLENQDAAPTTYTVPETDDTLYPVIQGAFTLNRIPKPYTQTFTPTNQYYSYMIDNFEGQII